MRAKELISDVIPVLRTSDTGKKALQFMDAFRVSHLPIVNNTEFLGLISDEDIYNLKTDTEPIGNYNLSLYSPFVYAHQHIYEVIALLSKLKLTVIPVLNQKREYLGVITMYDLVQYFADLISVGQPGGILVLKVHITDYSLNDIARIVESNDAKILSSYITSLPGTMMVLVTLKLNVVDVSAILQSFERFNYEIVSSFIEESKLDELIDFRYEEFMKYLEI